MGSIPEVQNFSLKVMKVLKSDIQIQMAIGCSRSILVTP